MAHTLMHKDLPVADLDFDQATGSIRKIGTIHHGSHLPGGVRRSERLCGPRAGGGHRRLSEPANPNAGDFYPYPATPGGFHGKRCGRKCGGSVWD
jgi:hypothetical protein